ncbi:SGNH/GDSL hydrolase family protein [Fischerella sp. NIES-3754]|uniref:SGNH/GDSL hydrolase family protein n=1 Tax=Fischerella sp. NIES-3754 TaxID=1752063 RepID=UPI0015D87479|nr:SGNH/GDSL hydrolase family protein [Fischerella sp. NIES-3754]
MKKQILVVLAFLSFIMVALKTSITNSHTSINELYVFGDSLSDIGNAFNATEGFHPSSPPYFQGRFSNGLVWVEYLASGLALTPKQNTNFAYGGATTGSGNLNGIPDLLTQVDSFIKVYQQVDKNALYILWAGANDYLHGMSNPSLSINNISQAIQSLAKAGAKKILVANLPDLGNIPATRNSPYSGILSSATIAHNLGLANSLDLLKQKLGHDTQMIMFDVHSIYKEAITNPTKFGFTDVNTACLNNLASCDNPDKFLFWDGIHPTTVAHRILAKAALKELKITF